MQLDSCFCIHTHIPSDQLLAKRMAHELLENKLAACVSISGPELSMYRWQDEIQADNELHLTIKASAHRLDEVIAMIKHLHPYELPEIIVLPIVGGHAEYLAWIKQETA